MNNVLKLNGIAIFSLAIQITGLLARNSLQWISLYSIYYKMLELFPQDRGNCHIIE